MAFCDGGAGGTGAPAGNNLGLSGPASGGVGAIGGNNLGLSGGATGATGDGITGDAGGASACFDITACLTGEGGLGGDSTGGNGSDAGANFGGFANGARRRFGWCWR